MNKKNIFQVLLNLVFLVIFNIVFFVAGGIQHEVSAWIAYGFIHFAYITLTIVPFFVRKSSSAAVFGLSLYSISVAYFIIEFIIGLIFILVQPEGYKVSLIVQIIIAGIYFILLFLNLIANEDTADNLEKQEAELVYVKQSCAMLKGLMLTTDDKALKKKIEKAYDLVHASPTKSNSSVRDYEGTVIDLIEVLERNISRNDVAAANATLDKIIKNANERNLRL